MREQVADRELARDPWIGQLKLGDVLRDAVVELELALVDEHGDRRGRHCLGRRSDRKARVLVGRLRRSLLQHAVALGEDDRIVFDDRDGERGDAPFSGGLCDVLVERRPVGFGLRGERHRRRDEQRCRQPSMCTHLTVRTSENLNPASEPPPMMTGDPAAGKEDRMIHKPNE